MRIMLLLATACVALGGCIVVRDHPTSHAPPPPPPQTTVTVTYGWNHHRYVVWREYYGCSDEEVYYLENCGYDDDDALVCLYIARRSRMPLRHVFFEYDRCGRSHYALAMSYRLPWDIWFCSEVPRGYGCPPVYARCYGDYWSGQPRYYSNDEVYALIHFQVGLRYYGYSHVTYFNEYNGCVQRGERAPFRAIVVKDYHAAGRGGRGWDEQRVVVRNDRPWNSKSPQEWEQKRQVERQQVQVRYTPQRQREEEDQARKAADSHKDVREESRRHVDEAKAKRQDDDRRHEAEEKARGPKPPGRPETDREPGRGPGKPEGPPKGPDRDPTPPRKPDADRDPRRPETPPKGPDRDPGPPPRKPDVERPKEPPPRGPERPKDPPPPPPRGPERRDPPPPPPKGPERKDPPPPPPKRDDDRKKGPSDDDKKKGPSDDDRKKDRGR